MQLEEIIKADAAYCREVSVKVCRKHDTVEIRDVTGDQEDIYLQGEDGYEFIVKLDGLIDQAPDVTFEDVMKHMAKPYVDNYWH